MILITVIISCWLTNTCVCFQNPKFGSLFILRNCIEDNNSSIMDFTPPTKMTTFMGQWVSTTNSGAQLSAPATSSRKRFAEETKMDCTDDDEDCIFIEERPLESKRKRPNWDSTELMANGHNQQIVPKLSFQAITSTTVSATSTTISKSIDSSTISQFVLNYHQSLGQLYSADVTDHSERPYNSSWLICTVKGCWKKVKDEEALVRHLVEVHSVWPYKCAMHQCPQSFATV